MKLAILRSDIEMLFTLISMNSVVPKRKIGIVAPSHYLSSVSWFSIYRIEEQLSP